MKWAKLFVSVVAALLISALCVLPTVASGVFLSAPAVVQQEYQEILVHNVTYHHHYVMIYSGPYIYWQGRLLRMGATPVLRVPLNTKIILWFQDARTLLEDHIVLEYKEKKKPQHIDLWRIETSGRYEYGDSGA